MLAPLCRTIHDLTTSIADLPPAVQQVADRLFIAEHAYANGGTTRITRVYNPWLGEATSFDERRRRRVPEAEGLERLQQRCEVDPGCYFCAANRDRLMVSHPAARLRDGCVLLPPSVRFSRNHCLVFPEEHNPLSLCSIPTVVDRMFTCAARWALETADADGGASFYFVAWNILCGSVIHGHLQASLTSKFAEGAVERMASIRRHYAACYASDFFEDMVAIHDGLGLTIRHGEAAAIPSLTPVKEREVWIMQQAKAPAALPDDLRWLMTQVLTRLATGDGPCRAFNIAVAFPPLVPAPEWDRFPVVARIVDRGWPLLGVSDWGAMEMFGTRIVATDPCLLASYLCQ